jgi:hypothetical protein
MRVPRNPNFTNQSCPYLTVSKGCGVGVQICQVLKDVTVRWLAFLFRIRGLRVRISVSEPICPVRTGECDNGFRLYPL